MNIYTAIIISVSINDYTFISYDFSFEIGHFKRFNQLRILFNIYYCILTEEWNINFFPNIFNEI